MTNQKINKNPVLLILQYGPKSFKIYSSFVTLIAFTVTMLGGADLIWGVRKILLLTHIFIVCITLFLFLYRKQVKIFIAWVFDKIILPKDQRIELRLVQKSKNEISLWFQKKHSELATEEFIDAYYELLRREKLRKVRESYGEK